VPLLLPFELEPDLFFFDFFLLCVAPLARFEMLYPPLGCEFNVCGTSCLSPLTGLALETGFKPVVCVGGEEMI
jgi:hypothetical protein